MTYAEYLRGLLESFPGYVEKSQPNEPRICAWSEGSL